jgi:hypothetical protein
MGLFGDQGMNDTLFITAIAYLLPGFLLGTMRPGEKDWQSGPESVKRLAQMLVMACTVVPGVGHLLGKRYVAGVLDSWASA